MKQLFVLALLCCEVIALQRLSLRDNEVHFLFLGYDKLSPASREAVLDFGKLFRREADLLYRRFRTKKPATFKLVVAQNAKTFAKLTRQNWYVAGLYDPESDRFYLQNLRSLTKLRHLKRVVRHELCHQIIERARGDAAAPQAWLQEVFCETLAPANSLSGNCKPSLGFRLFEVRLSKQLSHKSLKIRTAGYGCAAHLGSYLKAQLGERRFFETIVFSKTSVMRRLYARFVSTSR